MCWRTWSSHAASVVLRSWIDGDVLMCVRMYVCLVRGEAWMAFIGEERRRSGVCECPARGAPSTVGSAPHLGRCKRDPSPRRRDSKFLSPVICGRG